MRPRPEDIAMKLEKRPPSSWVGNPPPSFMAEKYFIFLKLKTACGIEGVGEVYAGDVRPRMSSPAHDRGPSSPDASRGHDPDAGREPVAPRARLGLSRCGPDPSLMGVMSGLEMACWGHRRQGGGPAGLRPARRVGRCASDCASYTYIYPAGGRARSDLPRRRNVRPERASRLCTAGLHRPQIRFRAGAYSAFDPRQPDLVSLDLSHRFMR